MRAKQGKLEHAFNLNRKQAQNNVSLLYFWLNLSLYVRPHYPSCINSVRVSVILFRWSAICAIWAANHCACPYNVWKAKQTCLSGGKCMIVVYTGAYLGSFEECWTLTLSDSAEGQQGAELHNREVVHVPLCVLLHVLKFQLTELYASLRVHKWCSWSTNL